MASNIIKINANNIANIIAYQEIGRNEELEIVYNSNGTEYMIQRVEDGKQFILPNELVDTLSDETNLNIEYIMDMLYEIYKAFDEMEEGHKNINIDYLIKNQNKILNIVSLSIYNFGYENVLTYFRTKKPYEIVKIFNNQNATNALQDMADELTLISENSDEDESGYTGIDNPDEKVDKLYDLKYPYGRTR